MNSDVEEIKNRLNIVDVLGEYIRLEKAGANYRALCPFHNEKSPSFMVSEEKQFWHCFGCQKSGDIFGFVMEIEGVEFREALKNLAEKAGVKLRGYNPQKAEEKNRTLEILELATKWYEYQLWNGPGKIKILNYLRERGLKNEVIKEFRLGYAPKGWRYTVQFLEKRGYKLDEIKRTGLIVEKKDAQPMRNYEQNTNLRTNGSFVDSRNIRSFESVNVGLNRFYDRFRERIMFPICDYSGKVVGFSARVAPGGDESQAKYVNTPETEVYHKSRILYGVDKAKNEARQKNSLLLVEGNMDVIAANQAGIKNTVAVSGTALTSDQIKIIKRYTPNIKMFFDMDSAGEAATRKSIKAGLAEEMNISVVTLPQGKDAADLAKDNPEKLVAAVENASPAMEYFYQKTLSKFDKNKTEDKKKITDAVLDMIASLGNVIEKNHWIKKLGADLDISEGVLTGLIKKATLNSVIPSKKISTEKEGEIDFRKKIDILICELIALALVFPEIWKKAVEANFDKTLLLKDSLLNFIFEKGQEVDFSFDNLVENLEKKEDKNRAERLYFEKKYRLDLNNNLEEINIENPDKELERILSEMKKEEKKGKLQKITTDLKIAEEKKDQEVIKFLRDEFNKITRDLV